MSQKHAPGESLASRRGGITSPLHERIEGVEMSIHPGDSMFRTALATQCGYRPAAVFDYFRSGLEAYDMTSQLLDWRFGTEWRGLGRLLDFGSGYGRLTRLLLQPLPADRLWCADVDPAAVEFQREQLGVQGIVTPVDPDDVPPVRDRFDAILSYSVLTHLPEPTFTGWLWRWLGALAEDGMLVFSVLDQSTLPPGAPRPREGFSFERWSESGVLSLDDYGSTRVTPEYVERVLSRVTPGEVRFHRFPRALWHLQDVYVVIRGAEPDPGELQLERGPAGCLETCELDASRRRLRLTGWAADPDGWHEPPEVVVEIDGERMGQCRPRGDWPGVARLLGAPGGALDAAWSVDYESADEIQPGAELRLEAISTVTGRRYAIASGTVDATLLLLPLVETSRRAEELQKQVTMFEASRFGRWRRRWMSLKQVLGRER